jgi:DNA-directed RNA polymerase subunit RPC12/RpoP
MSSQRQEDRALTCADCGREFVWTAGEQEYYREKGFADPPKRCKDCRQAKKAARDGDRGGGRGPH